MRLFVYLVFAVIFALMSGCSTAPVKNGDSTYWVDLQHREFSKIVETTVTENGVQLYLGADRLFRIRRTKLTVNGAQKIDSIAMIFKKYPKDQIAILVFTDNTGSSTRNLRLTQRRAEAIKAELVNQGVMADNISAVGGGDSQPIALNDTEENRAQNRRVEIDITR